MIFDWVHPIGSTDWLQGARRHKFIVNAMLIALSWILGSRRTLDLFENVTFRDFAASGEDVVDMKFAPGRLDYGRRKAKNQGEPKGDEQEGQRSPPDATRSWGAELGGD